MPIASGSGARRNVGSGPRTVQATPGLSGYCPVCVVNSKKWVKGDPRFQVVYQGKTYYFPSEEQRTIFQKDPDRYAPVLGGDCVVCLVDMGERVPGSVHYSAIYRGRLYLFPGSEQRDMFIANPHKYAQPLTGSNSGVRNDNAQSVRTKPDSSSARIAR